MTKTFLQNILSSALGFIIGFSLIICSIFILLIGTALISSLFSNESEIEANSVLKITFDYPIFDKPDNNPFKNFNPNQCLRS